MSHKKIALGAVAVLFSLVVTIAVVVASFSAIETINPVAAATAVTVAVIGMAWFKKSSH